MLCISMMDTRSVERTLTNCFCNTRICPGKGPCLNPMGCYRVLLGLPPSFLSQVITSRKRRSSSRLPCLSLYSRYRRTLSKVSNASQTPTLARGRFRKCFVLMSAASSAYAWVTPVFENR